MGSPEPKCILNKLSVVVLRGVSHTIIILSSKSLGCVGFFFFLKLKFQVRVADIFQRFKF